MNINKINLFISIIILFLLIIVLLSGISVKFSTDKNGKEKENCFVKEMIAMQVVGESVRNSNNEVNLEKKYGDNINILHTPLLVFRYSNYACNICIDFALDELKKVFPDYASNPNILFIASDYKSKTKTNFSNSINIKESNLGLSLEDTKLPFYFILVNDKAEHVFVPDKSAPELTKTYLSEIKKRYFVDN